MEHGLISFFELEQCGFFCKNGSEYQHEEGTVEDAMNSFCEWVKDRDFNQTIPWDVENHPRRQQIYCKSVSQDSNTGDTLLVLWKRYGDDSGKVSGISPDAKVGKDTGDSIKIDPKFKGQSAILGQPMYYWIVPKLNILATINFAHSCAATKEVCDYLKRCVDYRISHPRKKVTEREGINPNNGEPIISKLVNFSTEDNKRTMRFRFSASMKELNSSKANAARLASRISHIVVRDTISTNKVSEKDPIFTLWAKMHKKKKVSKQLEIVEEVALTQNELSEIIELHKAEYNPANKWNNIGFKEAGSDTIKWLDKYVSREHIRLPALAHDQNYYSANTMLKRILTERDILLSQFLEKPSTNDTASKI
ncbi:MAG TPA: hypothetical protein VL995_11195 [Cellvibrio sp.]|nr:hypothetical protein [Cellvibrio sp.]